jgi:hypothetical protein
MNVVTTVSCTAPGDCTAGGDYVPSQNARGKIYRPFVVTESGGSWGTAQEVPGIGGQLAADGATVGAGDPTGTPAAARLSPWTT